MSLTAEELPGSIAFNANELVQQASTLISEYAGLDKDINLSVSPLQGMSYRAAQERFCPREDGGASRRAVDFFFRGRIEHRYLTAPRGNKPTTVFWAGSAVDDSNLREFLAEAVAHSKNPRTSTALVIDRSTPIPRDLFARLKRSRPLLATISFDRKPPILFPDEVEEFERFLSLDLSTPEDISGVFKESPDLTRIFKREYAMRMGDATFNNVVLAPGIGSFEIALSAFALCGD